MKRRCLLETVLLALKVQFLNHLLFLLGLLIIQLLQYFLKIFILYGTSMGQNIWVPYGVRPIVPALGAVTSELHRTSW